MTHPVTPREEPGANAVSFEYPPLIALPADLSDEAAAQLLEWLYELAATLESHYAGQLHRYYHRPDERQQPLWRDDEPPF
jgi:hypothetical protein